jgi:hypothetical protein
VLPCADGCFGAVLPGFTLELGGLKDDGEAHLYETAEEEDHHEVEDHLELVDVAISGPFDHLADAEYLVGHP